MSTAYAFIAVMGLLLGIVQANTAEEMPFLRKDRSGDIVSTDPIKKLIEARTVEALAELRARLDSFKNGRGSPDLVLGCAERLVNSRLESTDKQSERKVHLEQYLEFMKDLEKRAAEMYEKHALADSDLHRFRYARLDAEVRATRNKRELDKQ